MITKFPGRWHFLSNFYPCEIEHKGIKYPSVEHYYVAMKVTEIQLFDGVHYTAGDFRELISKVKLPGDVKKIGQRVKIRKDWDDKKLQFMEWGVREKFKDPKIAELMLLTGVQDMIETNWWHDNFWGSCSCPKCVNSGQYNLGKILMTIRSEIRQNVKPSLEEKIKNK